ncbi:MAG: acyloxyacyl hydrolase [Balneolales bacterium]|nr:acyloxyacyl hydrolase [Balneolales bacterium]
MSVFFLGKTPNSQTLYSYFGKAKKVESKFPGTQMFITSGIIPLLAYDYEKRDDGGRKDNAWGAGISPFGVIFKTSGQKNVSFEYGIASGIVYMNKFFPTDRSGRLNYTIDLSISIEKKIFEQSGLLFGYKFHHISNAQTGTQNPGIDSNIFFISYKTYRHGN